MVPGEGVTAVACWPARGTVAVLCSAREQCGGRWGSGVVAGNAATAAANFDGHDEWGFFALSQLKRAN